MKIILFGAGEECKRIISYLTWFEEGKTAILAVADNNWDNIKCICGREVIDPKRIRDYNYDMVVIALDDLKKGNEEAILQINNQLLEMGIPQSKIVLHNYKNGFEGNVSYQTRDNFLKHFSQIVYDNNIEGAVAECGVWRGHFSAVINQCFPDRKLYLFDTFSSFDSRDLALECQVSKEWVTSEPIDNKMRNTSVEMVSLRCPHRENVVITQGYVPETLKGIEEKFVFVNLDMDLYAPQKTALEYFAPRMVKGGIILLHDYFHEKLFGVKKAVHEFTIEHGGTVVPIGDGCSVALIL